MKLSGRPGESQPEGVVVLDLVVGLDGSTHDIEVVQSADNELKKAAIAAVRKWKFVPATYEDKPVAAEIRIQMEFHALGEVNIRMGSMQSSGANPEQVQKLFSEASQAHGRHDYQAAVALSHQLITIAPLTKRIRLTLGASLLELNQYEEAEAAFQEEIKLEPESAFAYNQLGSAYWRHHKYEDAIAQFKKQISVTPEGHDAHANLGVLLCSRKKCSEAMPELEKALALSPNQSRTLLAHGECNVDFGNTAKGVSEMEEAANESGSANSWNQAAYRLAEQNVELERAQKWAETAITIESASLRSLSLDHVTPTQMRLVDGIANEWDTLGWIYFRRGQDEQARIYIEAAWRLEPLPVKGDHLGQIYEKLGRLEDAIRTYAMAIAAADLPTRAATHPEALAEAMERLTKIAGPEGKIPDLISRGHVDLDGLGSVAVENLAKRAGSADFAMRIASDKILEVRQIAGDTAFAQFAETLRKAQLPVQIPEGAGFEIVRRGRVSCKAAEGECHFNLLRAEEAFDLATKEANGANAKAAD